MARGHIKIEYDRFLKHIRSEAKRYSLLVQGHTEGKETTPEEDQNLEDEYVRFQLTHDIEESNPT